MHLLPYARRKEPLHHLDAADTERVFQALVRARAEAVERNGEALHA
jgi:hypothetical protein